MAADVLLYTLVAGLRGAGLVVHEVCEASATVEFFGLHLLDGVALAVEARNVWGLRAAIESLLRRRWTTGHALRAVLGR
eukprot:7976000-Pyramimonas_sp.AAC.1